MIFASLSGSSSLPEESNIMLACDVKINHLGLNSYPKRNKMSDANQDAQAAYLPLI